MDFQRYYDGVGLIVENKINNSFSTCPLCGEMKVQLIVKGISEKHNKKYQIT